MQRHDESQLRMYDGLAADDSGRSDGRPPLVLLHGLTFDRSMWRPALAELGSIDPGRRAVAFDLPGQGDSADAPPYSTDAVAERVHAAIVEAGLADPVIVGHSASAGLAAVYAARFATRGVVAVEGSVMVGGFAVMAQSIEPVLRGPGFEDAWGQITARVFRLDEVSADVQDFVRKTSRPRQQIVLGYWQELLEQTPQDLEAWVVRSAASIRKSGVPFVSVLGAEPSPEEIAWFRINLPEARIEVWRDSGHFPHVAHPHRFAQLLAETASWTNTTMPTLVGR